MNEASRSEWFQDARFGLFIHWGLYCVPAGEWKGERMEYIGEWIQSRFRIPNAEYERLANRFDPEGFDADAWVRLAKRAGMRYLVFTAKHHEGFAMYGSNCDPYNIRDATPFKRDPLAELADACRRHDFKLGLYYSQDLDWHEPHGGDPGPDCHKNHGMSWGNDWDFPDHSSKRYGVYFEKKVLPQLKELLTGYGPISVIWFDCPLTLPPECSLELQALVRELQPSCLINSRLGNGLGDYRSMGDNETPSGRVRGVWETPATLNDTWGYKRFDQNWKTAQDTLGILASLASRNVNYLLNVGPQPDGRFPEPAARILEEIGDWMEANGNALHGTRETPYPYGFDWGWMTRRRSDGAETLYALFKDWPTEPFVLRGLKSEVKAIREMTRPFDPISFRQDVNSEDGVSELRLDLPDEKPASVIPTLEIELAGGCEVDPRFLSQYPGVLILPADGGAIRHDGETDSTDDSSSDPSGPSISHAGILVGWLDPKYRIEWDAFIPSPGEYEAEIVTSAIHHSATWRGGHRVRLVAEDSSIEADVREDEIARRPETLYHPQAISRLGRIGFSRPGMQRVSLRPIEIRANAGAGLALVSLRLRRLSEAC